MDDYRPLSEVAELVGISRITLGRWAKAGRIKKRSTMVRNLRATLVSVAEVKAIVAKGVKPGRPRSTD